MKIACLPDGTPIQQQSVDWMIARAGIPTASEFDALVSPEWKVRTGEGPKTYLAKKLAERWQGGPLVGFNTFDVEQGQLLEGEAVPWYELEFNQTIERVGLITTDDGSAGCSPDGLLPGSGIEIKCPRVETHVGYLLAGELPKDYRAQVQGSMWVTGRPTWRFLSYRRHLPALLLTVEADPKAQAALTEALGAFLEAMDAGWARLCDINGGPPKRLSSPEPKPDFVSEFPS